VLLDGRTNLRALGRPLRLAQIPLYHSRDLPLRYRLYGTRMEPDTAAGLLLITGAGIGGEYSAVNSAIDELVPARVQSRSIHD